MGDTKIRIDISKGIVEAEGSENFVQAIYDEFKDRIDSEQVAKRPDGGRRRKGATKKNSPNKKKSTAKKRSGKGKAVPKIVKDLDLSGAGKKKRLRDFYAQYAPKTNFERNLIFVYYLEHELGISGISVDHVYSCYRDIPKVKAPAATLQSLFDTSHHKGWINTEKQEDITVTVPGINHLEHDMPKAESDS